MRTRDSQAAEDELLHEPSTEHRTRTTPVRDPIAGRAVGRVLGAARLATAPLTGRASTVVRHSARFPGDGCAGSRCSATTLHAGSHSHGLDEPYSRTSGSSRGARLLPVGNDSTLSRWEVHAVGADLQVLGGDRGRGCEGFGSCTRGRAVDRATRVRTRGGSLVQRSGDGDAACATPAACPSSSDRIDRGATSSRGRCASSQPSVSPLQANENFSRVDGFPRGRCRVQY